MADEGYGTFAITTKLPNVFSLVTTASFGSPQQIAIYLFILIIRWYHSSQVPLFRMSTLCADVLMTTRCFLLCFSLIVFRSSNRFDYFNRHQRGRGFTAVEKFPASQGSADLHFTWELYLNCWFLIEYKLLWLPFFMRISVLNYDGFFTVDILITVSCRFTVIADEE